jgi:hypothetical protein
LGDCLHKTHGRPPCRLADRLGIGSIVVGLRFLFSTNFVGVPAGGDLLVAVLYVFSLLAGAFLVLATVTCLFDEETRHEIWRRLVTAALHGGILWAVAVWWKTPDIWNVPLAKPTLGEIVEGAIKIFVMVALGMSAVRALIGKRDIEVRFVKAPNDV